MALPACPGCNRTIIPKSDDSCPNCGFRGVERGSPSLSVVTNQEPSPTVAEPERVDYGGFWIRLAAYLLDGIIMSPLTALIGWISGVDRALYFASFAPAFLFTVWFHVACVKTWGGTPGKLICGLRVRTIGLKPVGWKEAWLRQCVFLGLMLVGEVVFVRAALQMSPEEYLQLGFLDRSRKIGELGGVAQIIVTWATSIWTWGEFLVLLTNRERRAIHDFIAGTVVVRAKVRAAGSNPGATPSPTPASPPSVP